MPFKGSLGDVSGLGIRLYTDEDVNRALAVQLRYHGYDATGCQEAGTNNVGLPDEEQLRLAHGAGPAILVFNKKDYVPLDRAWKARRLDHHGIVLADQIAFGELVRRVRRHRQTVTPEQQYYTDMYLPR